MDEHMISQIIKDAVILFDFLICSNLLTKHLNTARDDKTWIKYDQMPVNQRISLRSIRKFF